MEPAQGKQTCSSCLHTRHEKSSPKNEKQYLSANHAQSANNAWNGHFTASNTEFGEEQQNGNAKSSVDSETFAYKHPFPSEDSA